ncbi:hypothetical protein [Paraburkholderia oxyphila]|uniref:hypothetical protein n=1 Tax=Paraburkholderia oxyphila TaxID=614212 RepID=UPI0012EE38D4
MTLHHRAEPGQWVLLEADPAVMTFRERPGDVQVDREQRLADFSVRYADRDKLVILNYFLRVESESTTSRKLDADVIFARQTDDTMASSHQTFRECQSDAFSGARNEKGACSHGVSGDKKGSAA